MNGHTPYMPWLDRLPEVGDPILRARARLQDLCEQAVELERQALALRKQVADGQADLLMRVMEQWTLADIQLASEPARGVDQVDDQALRDRIRALDGWHLAAEALLIFNQARVIRQHNLLSTASEAERLQTLARVLAWWNHVGRIAFDRLATK